MTFASLGLSPKILEAVTKKGYKTPSPIQAEAIPAVLAGKDVMAVAQTGTGKTAGFTLPMLEKLSHGKPAHGGQVRALILAPTRELAAQVHDSVMTYGRSLPLRYGVVYGGVKIGGQIRRLREGVDVLIATPGRLLDLFNQNAMQFKQLELLVLDEADRMLDMGFLDDIKMIMSLLPKKRQNLMFSATFSGKIRALAKDIVNNPVEITISPKETTSKNVKQWAIPVDKKQKMPLITHLIHANEWNQALIFTKTKIGADRLAKHLKHNDIKAVSIHGDKPQGLRNRILSDFKRGAVRIMVATDVAARGLDIDFLPHVVNFDLPYVAEDYVHRIGRTGRAGASGEAISLVSADESKQLFAVERLIKQILERKLIDGFEPAHDVPASGQAQEPRRGNKGRRPAGASKKPFNKKKKAWPQERKEAKAKKNAKTTAKRPSKPKRKTSVKRQQSAG
ncbi:MAG: ATP-dependent RNA helicase RhlE [marine bacterium B5-7]|nr:MAG: ATP-dependent RNA helicase RhlE [marine bacterium B5-7]